MPMGSNTFSPFEADHDLPNYVLNSLKIGVRGKHQDSMWAYSLQCEKVVKVIP